MKIAMEQPILVQRDNANVEPMIYVLDVQVLGVIQSLLGNVHLGNANSCRIYVKKMIEIKMTI